MASLLSGFEYDVFISYRHNDNRSGWVTEFVRQLNEELAATIKEPLSVYFDNNRHDGLLETHNVDKSLEGKLKCLILSRSFPKHIVTPDLSPGSTSSAHSINSQRKIALAGMLR